MNALEERINLRLPKTAVLSVFLLRQHPHPVQVVQLIVKVIILENIVAKNESLLNCSCLPVITDDLHSGAFHFKLKLHNYFVILFKHSSLYFFLIDACVPGTWSTTGLPPCIDCDVGFYETSYGSISCQKCSGNSLTIKEGSTRSSDCYGKII